MKTNALLAVALMAGSMASAYAKDQVVTLVAGTDGAYSASIGDTVVGDSSSGTYFTDTYTFSGSTLTSTAFSSILSTVSLNDTSGITFDSVSLNNVAYDIINGSTYTLPSLAIGAGAISADLASLTLTVTGVARGTASYGGSFGVGTAAVSAVPEPSTYAMLLGGLGLIGFMRRRRSGTNA